MKKILFLAGLILITISCIVQIPRQIKPQAVIDAFKNAGLEAENTRPMTKEDYGFAPLGDEGIRFFIPSLGPDHGGRVVFYKDLNYLEKAQNFYKSLGKESAILYTWVFTNGNILVQINGDLPEDKAREYEKALNELK